MSTRLFTEERSVILEPLKARRCRLIRDKEEFEQVKRASEIMLTAEEPSIRTVRKLIPVCLAVDSA